MKTEIRLSIPKDIRRPFQAIFLLSLFIGIFLVLACSRESEEQIVRGSVRDANQNLPIGQAEVKVYLKKLVSGTYTYNFIFEKSVQTNADGSFELTIPNQHISDFKFVVIKDQYFEKAIEISGDDLEDAKYELGVVPIVPQATLAVHIRNQYPLDGNDEIRFHVKEGWVSCPTCCSYEFQSWIGTSVDVEFNCLVEGKKKIVLEWITIRNGINTPHVQEFQIDAFEQKSVEIFY